MGENKDRAVPTSSWRHPQLPEGLQGQYSQAVIMVNTYLQGPLRRAGGNDEDILEVGLSLFGSFEEWQGAPTGDDETPEVEYPAGLVPVFEALQLLQQACRAAGCVDPTSDVMYFATFELSEE